MCIRDRNSANQRAAAARAVWAVSQLDGRHAGAFNRYGRPAVSYTHLRAHETVLDLVCRLLLEKKTNQITKHILNNLQHTTKLLQ